VDEPLPGYALTVEQEELRKTLRRFLASTTPESRVRALMDTSSGFDRATWSRLGAELGVLGLSVPENLGGSGAGLVEQAIVCEEFGRSLFPGPVFGTINLAIPLLSALADNTVLPSMVIGERTATVAFPHGSPMIDLQAITVTQSDGVLNGQVAQTVDGAADVLIVAAKRSDDFGLYLVEDAQRVELPTLDQTRRQSRVTLEGVKGIELAAGPEATRAVESALCAGTALLAAEQVGGAQRMLELCVEYAGTRWQFGRKIGSFQAIKHRCADMLVLVEHARSAAYHAVGSLESGTDDARLVTSMAKAICSQAFLSISNSAIQIHGGIGFTWEHPAHRYLKRAVTDAALLGSADMHLDLVASRVLDCPQDAA
jgi:alkylation response protein AidB-like acyl-CoA dehydrogenase